MSSEKWFLSKKFPDDYKTVEIESTQHDDPQGTRRFCADGTCPVAKVWLVDLIRGGIKVESDILWSHHPPLDVVIYQLDEEEFKKLLCRERNEEDKALEDKGLPVYEPTRGMLGKGI